MFAITQVTPKLMLASAIILTMMFIRVVVVAIVSDRPVFRMNFLQRLRVVWCSLAVRLRVDSLRYSSMMT